MSQKALSHGDLTLSGPSATRKEVILCGRQESACRHGFVGSSGMRRPRRAGFLAVNNRSIQQLGSVLVTSVAETAAADIRAWPERRREISLFQKLKVSVQCWAGGEVLRHHVFSSPPGTTAFGTEHRMPGSFRYRRMIGIGAAVTRRPLPHHRAYGSVQGGSSQSR